MRYLIFFVIGTFSFQSCNLIFQSKPDIKEILFDSCSNDNSLDTLVTKENKFFTIKYPSDWTIDNELPQGLDISSANFPDSLKRGFLLSIIPYQDFYVNKNPQVKYNEFYKAKYDSLECIYLVRNDLFPIDNTVYWRAELRIISTDGKNIYLLVFGLRSLTNIKPNWCDYKQIINSLTIKN